MKAANLDHLRALAVSLVLGAHTIELIEVKYRWLRLHPYHFNIGRAGVLLFFVHTSLVLCQSMERLGLNGFELLKSFLVRRLFRIYPLAIITVLLVAFFNVPTLPWLHDGGHWTLGELASDLALTMNLTYSAPMLVPLWSLPLEVQMYIALPVVFMLLGPRKHPLQVLAMLIAAMALAGVQPFISNRANVAQFAPCFLAGVLTYTLFKRVRPQWPAWLWLPFLITALAIFAVYAPLPGEGKYPPQWLLCLVVGAAIPMFRDSQSTAGNAASHKIATYSYGIYLFHCIALWIGCVLLDKLPDSLQWATAAAILIGACVASYHLIEVPAIKLGAALARRMEVKPPLVVREAN